MKKSSLKFLFIMALMAIVAVSIATTTTANDNGLSQSIGEYQLVEWDGTTLHERAVHVFSTEEQDRLTEWNEKNRALANSWQRQQNGEVEGNVIETEHGIVTVSKTENEHESVAAPSAEIDIELVKTPYGTITIEKQSFGSPVNDNAGSEFADADDVDTVGTQPLPFGLSEYTDPLYASCGSNGVEFNFGSNNTSSNYELHWSGGSYSNSVTCYSSSCNFKITTSWSAYYTYGYAYTTVPGYVHGFGFNDYRCH